MIPMYRAQQAGDRRHALALSRSELAVLLSLIEVLFGPGWAPKDKPGVPAGLLAGRTGRGAATDRLGLLLMVLTTGSAGWLQLCPGSVDTGRGRRRRRWRGCWAARRRPGRRSSSGSRSRASRTWCARRPARACTRSRGCVWCRLPRPTVWPYGRPAGSRTPCFQTSPVLHPEILSPAGRARPLRRLGSRRPDRARWPDRQTSPQLHSTTQSTLLWLLPSFPLSFLVVFPANAVGVKAVGRSAYACARTRPWMLLATGWAWSRAKSARCAGNSRSSPVVWTGSSRPPRLLAGVSSSWALVKSGSGRGSHGL